MSTSEKPNRKELNLSRAWAESRELIWEHRRSLAIGMAIMLINRLSGLVLPGSSKYLIDDVIGKGRGDLLLPLALAAGGATLIQAVTAFALSQVVSVAAQRAITDMRSQRAGARTRAAGRRTSMRTKTGALISRIMSDAEGIRNLVGTGIIQLIGGFLTALIGLGVLFYLNWQLTTSRSSCCSALAG